jgi:integrase
VVKSATNSSVPPKEGSSTEVTDRRLAKENPLGSERSGNYNDRLSEEVTVLIANYKPQIPAAHWVPIAEFTRACVSEVFTTNSTQYAREFMTCTARFVIWSTRVASLDLDREEIFHPSTVDRYMELLRRDNTSKLLRHVASILRQMSAAFTGTARDDFRPVEYQRRSVLPYPPSEFPRLASWVDGQAQPGRRRNTSAIIGFCQGAGLRARELTDARVEDVIVGRAGLSIAVGGQFAREVPVHALWEDYARAALAHAEPGEYIVSPTAVRGGHPIDAVKYSRVAGREVPSVLRLRATWIVRALDLLPARAVQHFAGLGPLGAVDMFLGHRR